jgi:hypothetical protein
VEGKIVCDSLNPFTSTAASSFPFLASQDYKNPIFCNTVSLIAEKLAGKRVCGKKKLPQDKLGFLLPYS